MVECKHRQSLDTRAAIKGTKVYRDQIGAVLETNANVVLIFRKDDLGQWICWHGLEEVAPLMDKAPQVVDCLGLTWTLYQGFTDEGRRELLALFSDPGPIVG